jgi:hypothetical protein
MARPQVANGEDGLHIRTVAANILNKLKQSWTANKGWSSTLELGVEVTTHQRKDTKWYTDLQFENLISRSE